MRAYKGCKKPKLLTRKVALPPFSYATSKALTRREPFKPIRASSAAWPAWPAWRAETDRQAAVCRTARPRQANARAAWRLLGGTAAMGMRLLLFAPGPHLHRTAHLHDVPIIDPLRISDRYVVQQRALAAIAAIGRVAVI